MLVEAIPTLSNNQTTLSLNMKGEQGCLPSETPREDIMVNIPALNLRVATSLDPDDVVVEATALALLAVRKPDESPGYCQSTEKTKPENLKIPQANTIRPI
jgi:hypothetical protein